MTTRPAAAAAHAAPARPAVATVTALGQAPLAAVPVSFGPPAALPEGRAFVYVDPARRFQSILGIGGAITDAAADAFAALPESAQEGLLRALFDPREGFGYSLLRVPVHSSDFSAQSYTYVAEGDASLASFDIAPDRARRLPLVKRALAAAGGKLTVFASPWSPPAWMKDNGSVLQGGRLLPEHRRTWADYLVRFVRAWEAEGVPLWGLTVQNEPMAAQTWESCLFTAEEEADFLKLYLGPAFRRAGLGSRKLLIWDHNRDQLFQRASAILGDPAAARFVGGIAYHWYEGWSGPSLHENVRRVHEAWPELPLVFSEACLCPKDEARTLDLSDWSLGETYARELIRDFNAGASAFADWNLLLDERGGPNHAKNFCYAGLHVDRRTGALTRTSVHWYLGHFSKWVRPGARRLAVAPSTAALEAVAFENPDGSLAVVVLNTGAAPVDYHLWLPGRAAAATAPARSITTFALAR